MCSSTPRSTLAVVEDQEQVDKLLEIADRAADARSTSSTTTRAACATTTTPRLHAHRRRCRSAGRETLARDPRAGYGAGRPIAAGEGGDVAVMLYTSGTTGKPKGVVLTHDNVLICRRATAMRVRPARTDDEEVLAYLPLAWVGDHLFSYAQWLVGGLLRQLPGERARR